MLKQIKIYGLSLAVILSLNMSCTAIQNSNKTQRGAGIGVAAGALVGGLIGGNIGGALIGAAIGGAAGAVIGKQMDKQADKIEEAVPGAEVKRVGEGIQIIFDDKSGVNFAFDSADLTPEAKKNLDAVAEIFIEFPDTELMIEGHTDSVGDENYNMKLSQRRANSVVAYLKAKGVAANRFKVEAFGETRPRFENDTKENQAKNRRVEIGVAANEQMIEDAKAQTE
ncbi:OmpA family protein [Lutimonas saemankumensis]|uniref:OmpA family protein n=1 Tax=Lutimonas saemankumensis TaxID=483016 RepID=UPI001CD72347|nr:OmpA family protein [Lutimonas saemankumensis]MCA0931846.1 OmpA family protein [Lutimonas saemankumensis]